MSKAEKKIVLAKPGFENTNLGTLFIECGFTILSDINSDVENSIYFIIDDHLIDNQTYPRIRTDRKISKLKTERAFIDANNLNEKAKSILKSYFNENEEMDLVDRYSKDVKDLFTLKIQDYLNFGYFIDTVVVEAYKAQFDVEKIRKYLNETLEYTFRLIESKGSLLPIEVSFSHDGERFVTQIATTVREFKFERDYLGNSSNCDPAVNRTNYFDLTYIESRERLIISSLWFKEKTNFQSQFFTVIEKRKVSFKNNNVNLIVATGEEKVNYQPYQASDKNDLTLAGLIRKLVLFVKNKHKNESNFNFKAMTLEQVKADIFQYPITSEVEDLDNNTYQKVLDILRAGVEEEAGNRTFGSDNHISEENSRVSGKIDEDNFKQIVKSKLEAPEENDQYVIARDISEDDEVQTVKGNSETEENEVLKVKTIQNDLEVKLKDLESKFKESEFKHQKAVEQNSKMKKIIEAMKSEYLKLKTTVGTTSLINNTSENIVQYVQSTEPNRSMKQDPLEQIADLKNREKQLLKLKSDLELINTSKDVKIAQLESKLENFKSEFYKSDEFTSKEKVSELESENKMLNSKIELMTKNMAAVTSNNTQKENDMLVRKEKEVETLKNQMKMAHALIQKFKTEKVEQEEKFKSEIDELRRLKLEQNLEKGTPEKVSDSVGSIGSITKSNSNHEELQKQLEEKVNHLQAEKKALEEKYKDQGLEMKKIEHRLKITSTQLEEANKKNARPEKAKANSNDAYIRQLEFANKKLSEVSEDLTEKKRELLKIKQENQQLSTKVTELEKKVAQADKKAA